MHVRRVGGRDERFVLGQRQRHPAGAPDGHDTVHACHPGASEQRARMGPRPRPRPRHPSCRPLPVPRMPCGKTRTPAAPPVQGRSGIAVLAGASSTVPTGVLRSDVLSAAGDDGAYAYAAVADAVFHYGSDWIAHPRPYEHAFALRLSAWSPQSFCSGLHQPFPGPQSASPSHVLGCLLREPLPCRSDLAARRLHGGGAPSLRRLVRLPSPPGATVLSASRGARLLPRAFLPPCVLPRCTPAADRTADSPGVPYGRRGEQAAVRRMRGRGGSFSNLLVA
mmetsp:Transcript_37340/g.88362  ORF Transcript_37340/g.88362 Transcript_37340/m.88362 type:complete len:279 (+) Transcript_37340:3570-4406(+)